MKKLISWFNKRTINQKLTIVGIISPAITAILVALLTKTLITFNLNLEIKNIVEKKVETEIANIEDSIKQIYDRKKTVYFSKALFARTKLFYGDGPNSEELSISCFQLDDIPVNKTINFFAPYNGMLPQNAFLNFNNIVCIKTAGKIESIFKDNNVWFSIEYFADAHSSASRILLKDIDLNYDKGHITIFDKELNSQLYIKNEADQ